MHKLLARQLRAARADGNAVDIERLIAIVDQAYQEFDRERRFNDRAATLMEEELRSANAQAQRDHDAVLAAILRNASDGMLVIGDDGAVTITNLAAEREFAAPPGGLVGMQIERLLGKEAGELSRSGGLAEQVRKASALGFDGRSFPVEVSFANVEISGGRRQLWIVRDISERVRTECEILENRMRFQDFAEASSDCFWEMDAYLENVSVTSSFEPDLPRRISSLLTPPLNGIPAGIDEATWEALQRHLSARQRFRMRLSVRKEDGEILYLSITGKPVFRSDGIFSGYRGTARNLTREILAREAARLAQQRLIEAIDAAPSAMALLDRRLAFVAGNSALKEMAQASGEILAPGRSFTGFLAKTLRGVGESGETSPARLLEALAFNGEMREVTMGGCWYLLAACGLSDGGTVLNFSDVTMLKQREYELGEAKQAAESASRLKSQFLATMSHELRTPLNAILGFSEVIRDAMFGIERHAVTKYTDYAGSIHTSGRHLLSLISESLDLSKIEAGTYLLDRGLLDLREILESAVTIIRPAADKAGGKLRVNLSDDQIMVWGDDRALRQIALNLLANAVKFTPKSGSVTLDVARHEGAAEFSVTDTGIGIAREHLHTVFELFRQVDSSIQRRHEGTGLGLAITKRLVELHGGTIALNSELSVGTAVHVWLPVEAPQGVQPHPAEAIA